MKKTSVIFFVCLMAITVCMPELSRADGSCATMKIVHVGTSPSSPSGVSLYLKNETGAVCGTIAIGATVNAFLPEANANIALATVLTAASLQKPIWGYFVGTGDPYLLPILQVKDIAE